jgi:hypothetical protein
VWNPFRTPPSRAELDELSAEFEALKSYVYRNEKRREMRERRAEENQGSGSPAPAMDDSLPYGVRVRRMSKHGSAQGVDGAGNGG